MVVGNFDLKIPTENIPSVNPLVFSEFLVVFFLQHKKNSDRKINMLEKHKSLSFSFIFSKKEKKKVVTSRSGWVTCPSN